MCSHRDGARSDVRHASRCSIFTAWTGLVLAGPLAAIDHIICSVTPFPPRAADLAIIQRALLERRTFASDSESEYSISNRDSLPRVVVFCVVVPLLTLGVSTFNASTGQSPHSIHLNRPVRLKRDPLATQCFVDGDDIVLRLAGWILPLRIHSCRVVLCGHLHSSCS